MTTSQVNHIRTFILMIYLACFPLLASAGSICSSTFLNQTLIENLAQGKDIGPIEWLFNIKYKWKSSDKIRKFNVLKYQDVFNFLNSRKSFENFNYKPKNTEAYIAMLDWRLSNLNISINEMDPVFRHKTYRLVEKILKSEGRNSNSHAQQLAELVFRGHFQKPTSFSFLFTRSYDQTSREMLLQHLHALVVTGVVVEIVQANQPEIISKKGFLSRITPQALKDHQEIFKAGLWFGVGVVQSAVSENFLVFLAPFNILKTKANKQLIETTLQENGLEKTVEILGKDLQTQQTFSYFYAILEKTLNWYTVGYVLAPFFLLD